MRFGLTAAPVAVADSAAAVAVNELRIPPMNSERYEFASRMLLFASNRFYDYFPPGGDEKKDRTGQRVSEDDS